MWTQCFAIWERFPRRGVLFAFATLSGEATFAANTTSEATSAGDVTPEATSAGDTAPEATSAGDATPEATSAGDTTPEATPAGDRISGGTSSVDANGRDAKGGDAIGKDAIEGGASDSGDRYAFEASGAVDAGGNVDGVASAAETGCFFGVAIVSISGCGSDREEGASNEPLRAVVAAPRDAMTLPFTGVAAPDNASLFGARLLRFFSAGLKGTNLTNAIRK